MAGLIKKKIQQYAAYETLNLALMTHRLTAKRWKKIFQANISSNLKEAEVGWFYQKK